MSVPEMIAPPPFRIRESQPGESGGQKESPTLPLPPPRDQPELERLLQAVASTPSGERQLIVDTLAAFTDRDAVAQLLHENLRTLPCLDVSRHLTLLAVIGQLRHEASSAALEHFVWLPDTQIVPPRSHFDGTDGDHDGQRGERSETSKFWLDGAMQARAAEMLVWVDQGRNPDAITRILTEHPHLQVRLSTIDAVAYSFNDESAALDSLRERVREDDRWAVGLPRRTSDMDAKYFDAAVRRHQEQYNPAVPMPPVRQEQDEEDHDVR